MEKYHDWRDAFTGLHPFLPYAPKDGLGLVRLLISLVRAPVVMLLGVLFALVDVVTLPVGSLHAWVVAAAARVVLFASGFLWVRSTAVGSGADPIGPGHVVLCSHKSYVDVLLMAAQLAPLFGRITSKGVQVHRTVWGALRADVRTSEDATASYATVADAATYARSLGVPLLLFPEGVWSNHEKCLLQPEAHVALALRPRPVQVHVRLVHYSAFVPFTGTRSALSHWFVCLLGPLHHDATVHTLGNRSIGSGDEWFNQAWNRIAAHAGYRVTRMDASQHADFLDKWYETH